MLRIEHLAPHVARAHVALAAPRKRVADVPVIHAQVAVEHAARQLVVARENRAGAAPAPRATHVPDMRRTTPPPVLAQAPAAAPVAAQAAPTAAPVATPAPSPVAAQREDGIGNFGETYPASIEPSLRGSLLAGLNGFVVRISVDENGRATSVDFVRAPADPAQRDELRTRLLAAHWIPAACNGLRCAGTVELRN
jgi:hypothetical protein